MTKLKLTEKVINPFPPEGMQRLLCADFPTECLAARDRAMILLFLDTDIRLAELNSSNFDDLDLERQRLRVLNRKMKKRMGWS